VHDLNNAYNNFAQAVPYAVCTQCQGLELDAPALPSLATNCVLVGHAQKADVVWTRDQFMALCGLMLNRNELNFFLIPYREEDGAAHFAKAKKVRADKRAAWAWDQITGRAKNPASIGFYPRNRENQSRWAAIDFDAHDDDGARARELALTAFQLLYRHPQLFVVLCTSGGGGWHLFVFSRDFHPVEDWIKLLKQAATIIGANIRKGECEIFPSDSRGQIGYGIRAPGTWNPKHDTFSLIAYENVAPLLFAYRPPLPTRAERERKRVSLSSRSNNGEEGHFLTYRGKGPVYRGEFDKWQTSFAITAPRTRHEKLKELVCHIFRQVSREMAQQNAELQYCEKTVQTKATLAEHLSEFEDLWDWLETQWLVELSESEHEKFDDLKMDSKDRDAFRIIRNFARLVNDAEDDFRIVADHLAKRLAVTLQTACNIRRRFCGAGILVQTAPHTPQRFSARFRWTANEPMTTKTLLAVGSSNGSL
jgi:hypothetical protein